LTSEKGKSGHNTYREQMIVEFLKVMDLNPERERKRER
jgi:hypothetical protein